MGYDKQCLPKLSIKIARDVRSNSCTAMFFNICKYKLALVNTEAAFHLQQVRIQTSDSKQCPALFRSQGSSEHQSPNEKNPHALPRAK